MIAALEAWAVRPGATVSEERRFELWLIQTLAGVLLEKKAGELLVLTADASALSLQRQLQRLGKLTEAWGLSTATLCRCEGCARVVAYRPELVAATLSNVPRWVYQRLGHIGDARPDRFLEELGCRWREHRRIPHEIGFTLGYPLKDVLGFMRLLPLPFSGACGWRIYGDPVPSLRLSREHESARRRVAAALGFSAAAVETPA